MTRPEATALERAHTLVELERWDEAAQLAATVLASDPSSVDAMCLLAQSRLRAGRPAEAAEVAARAAAADPEGDWPLRLLAFSAAGAGLVDQSLRAARAAIAVRPQLAECHIALATALVDAGRARDAVEPARQAVSLAPHDPDAHNMLGVALARDGDREGARSAYREALRLEPGHAVAINNIAALDLDARRLGRAARGVAAGLTSDPHDEVLRQNLDLLGERLVHRLLNAMLLSGFLLLVVFFAEENGDLPPRWPRALAGLGLIALYAGVVWATLRHLPAGMRRHLRSLPRRTRARWRWLLLAVVSLALLLLAFAPGDAAAVGGSVFIVIIRIVQAFLVFVVLRALLRRARRSFGR